MKFGKLGVSTCPVFAGPVTHYLLNLSVATAGIDNLPVYLDVHKASGFDHISARINAHQTCLYITNYLSAFLGSIPQDWKTANVVHKKGDKNAASNYRRISLVSISSKLFKHILASQIMQYIILSPTTIYPTHNMALEQSPKLQFLTVLTKCLNICQNIQLLV